MTIVESLLARNRAFASSGDHRGKPIYPDANLCVVTCLDPRTDPAVFLGLSLGDAAVIRNAGGRITQTVIDDLALISYLADTRLRPGDEPLFEVVVIHHNKCGTSFLDDSDFRHAFGQFARLSENDLLAEAVTVPADSVAADVDVLLSADVLSRRISVSGHVYDVDTGLLTTIVPTTPMPGTGSIV